MAAEVVLHLHGFASSAASGKARFLMERFGEYSQVRFLVPDFNPTPRDFEYLTITGMINRLRQYMIDHDHDAVRIVASSLGCLVALHYAHRFGGVKRLLLLAPLLSYSVLPIDEEERLRWEQEGAMEVFHYGFNERIPLRYTFHQDGLSFAEEIPPPAPVMILHGKRDETIPLRRSSAYASRYPGRVTLRELESDHTLLDQLEIIWEHVTSFLLFEGNTGEQGDIRRNPIL